MKSFKKMALFYRPEPPRGMFPIGQDPELETLQISILSSNIAAGVCSFVFFQDIFISPSISGLISVGDFLFSDENAQFLFPSGGTNESLKYYLVRKNSETPSFIVGLSFNQIMSISACEASESTVKFDVINNSSSAIINNVEPNSYIILSGVFPLTNGEFINGVTSPFSNAIFSININASNSNIITIKINLVGIETINVLSSGIYQTIPFTVQTGDNVLIELNPVS